MNSFPFWAYPAISLFGLLSTGGVVYLMANAKRNNRPKTVTVVAEDGHLIGTGYMRHRRTFAEITIEMLDEVGHRVRPSTGLAAEKSVAPKNRTAPADAPPKI